MLKGIHPLVNPPLLHALALMGHGDELTLADRNFPAYAADRPVVHLDGVGVPEAARAILQLFPLDDFVDAPVLHMADPSAAGELTEVQRELVTVAEEAEGRSLRTESVPRMDFYARARRSRVVVLTGETRPYGCFVLVKGVLS